MAQIAVVATDQHTHLQTWTEMSVARETKHNCHFPQLSTVSLLKENVTNTSDSCK
jgi:hypothetical protein